MGQSNIDKDKQRIGEEGWLEAMKLLNKSGWELQQIDWLGRKNEKWVKFEIKAQESFKAPPFDGHGLPNYQIEKSMKLLFEKDIPTYLLIKDLESGNWLGQYLHILENGKHFDTKIHPRRIYPIENFVKLKK